ncbi:hypothetical protein Q6247_25570, partial [Klebsiella pneumoniae]
MVPLEEEKGGLPEKLVMQIQRFISQIELHRSARTLTRRESYYWLNEQRRYVPRGTLGGKIM